MQIFVLNSFDTPGSYYQRIQYENAENHVINNTNNQTRKEYPLVLILHRLIDDDNPVEFFRLVRRVIK